MRGRGAIESGGRDAVRKCSGWSYVPDGDEPRYRKKRDFLALEERGKQRDEEKRI